MEGANQHAMAQLGAFLPTVHVWRQVLPALGAEQVVEFCGGVAAVLRAVASDVHRAALQPLPQEDSSGADDAADECAALSTS